MASSSIFKEIPPGKTCKFENNGCNKSLRPRNEVALSLFKKYIDVYCPTAASFQDSVIKLG
ncbi:MAG: hypothetical protein NT051_02070, partial [Candidatus Micrarchaeota archaeon]|nr:hypothetical protein [Candidatus Micrarchaeota archaeon]